MTVNNITPSVDINYWLKRFDTNYLDQSKFNKSTNSL